MKKLTIVVSLWASVALAELQPESPGIIESLPDTWPAHWIIAADASFFHMSDGKFIVLDADSDDPNDRFKGFFNGSLIANFAQATSRPEMYIAETFRSRGQRGERTDVLTIISKSSLEPIGEVVIPPKRSSNMPTAYNVSLVDDEKLALVYNFTPAQSVTVVDVVEREFLAEIPTPGCALAYPMPGRAFASICADASIMAVTIGDDGRQQSSTRTAPFFDVAADPLMEKPVIYGGIAYFPTFLGNVYPVDLNGSTPVVGEPWSMVGDEQGGWRPGGILFGAADSAGNLYFLMHPEGSDGTHKDPGVEVWVFDRDSGRRSKRIELALPALSINVTRDEEPLLVATNVNMEIDVYDAASGQHQRTLGNFGQETPLTLWVAQ
ncbi:MAG: amine dehydrogenase large subunit [Woeseiaceae bacterium]|nr:amine dehydrogenase large subunit [Woeseiaceae bacterium]